jgi:drug/metabolite transporter (DMT)-like permease
MATTGSERAGAPATGDATLAGIGFMLLGMFMFSANDVLGKWLVASVSVGVVLFFRSVAALVMLAPMIARAGPASLWPREKLGLHMLRGLLSALETATFYWAVVYLPLADVVTFYLAGPIFVTVLAVPLLGESIGWRRSLAVAVGFIGVLVALQPSAAALTGPAVIAFAGSLLYALLIVTTRMLKGTADVTLITWQVGASLLTGLVLALFHWTTPTLPELALIALLGVVATLAHMAINRSLKLAPASVTVPYQYSLIVWAVLFGFIVFGDVPGWHVVLGSAIICGAGLYIFLREEWLKRQGGTNPSSAPMN